MESYGVSKKVIAKYLKHQRKMYLYQKNYYSTTLEDGSRDHSTEKKFAEEYESYVAPVIHKIIERTRLGEKLEITQSDKYVLTWFLRIQNARIPVARELVAV
ncbi:MAG: DUF4238 domain-containing protein [Bacteroidetes bacterium]|nr:DUF4238 domain-containing protein [Bacteroidota bacterium]